jgi:hypothetical protein
MSFNTMASVGLEAFKHRQQIGAALHGAAGLAGAAKGELFGKIFGNLEAKQNQAAGPDTKDGLNSLQALTGFGFFDADHNGQLSKQELTEGLQKLSDSGLGQNGPYAKLNEFGQKLLQNYDQAAALDGNGTGFSYRDLGDLAKQDGQAVRISNGDWQKLLG